MLIMQLLTRCSRLSNSQGFTYCRHNIPHFSYRCTELTQRLKNRHLVNVLQSTSTLTTDTQKHDGWSEISNKTIILDSYFNIRNTHILCYWTIRLFPFISLPAAVWQMRHPLKAKATQPSEHSSLL